MKKNINEQYISLLKEILKEGYIYTDKKRNVKCKQIDSHTLDIDLTKGFPAINLKKLYWKGVVGELLWFLKGDTNIKYLVDNNINIWNKDAYNWYKKSEPGGGLLDYNLWFKHTPCSTVMNHENDFNNPLNTKWGNLGRIYGAQWRQWKGVDREIAITKDGTGNGAGYFKKVDQISNLIKNLKEKPMSRRHIVTAWNPAELDDMALPPCHWSFEIIVRPINKKEYRKKYRTKGFNKHLSGKEFNSNIPEYGFTLKWNQRSVDTYLGLPFNIASYALLAHIIGKFTNMVPTRLIGNLSNVHLYENSWEASKELLKRDPLKHELPQLSMLDEFHYLTDENIVGELSVDKIISELRIDMFILKNYQSYPNIPVEMLAPKIKK